MLNKIFNFISRWKAQLLLIPILILAFCLRFIDLTNNPPELYRDELHTYLSAKSMVEEGRDLRGRRSLYFSDFHELTPPVYGYSAYLSSKLLGESTLSIRLPAVLFGLISIFILYLLTLELTGNHLAALLSSFFLSILPWHIHYSRIGWEPASMLPFILSATVLLIRGINKNQSWMISLGFGFFSLAIYTYQPAPLFAFLLLLAIVCFNYKYFVNNPKNFFIGVLSAGFIALPYFWIAVSEPIVFERAKWMFTFANGINIGTIREFLNYYFTYFGIHFLIQVGDSNPRHGAQTGVIYWWMVPLMIMGLILIFKSVKKRWYIGFIAFWVLVYPLPGSLSNDGVPHATRTLIGAPVFCLLSAIGLWRTLEYISASVKSKVIYWLTLSALLMLALISLIEFSTKYFSEYPVLSSKAWN
jgi:4-amino-4-deoxy-L-arabinose transferase-like glycosyltransferase